MSKKILTWICIVLPLALVGLLAMQFWWINQAVKMRDDMFDKSVFRSIDQVILRLEADERNGSLNYRPQVPSALFGQRRSDKTSMVKNELKINFKIDNFGYYSLEVQDKGKVISTRFNSTMGNSQYGNNIEANAYLTLRNVLNSQLDAINADAQQSTYENRPIETRVNSQRLDALLMREFNENGIEELYEYAVVNASGNIAFASTGYHPDEEKNKVYTKVLFPHDTNVRAHYVSVYFNTKPSVLSSLAAMIVPTVFFFLVVMCLSIFTIVIIFRQKKIDVIKNDFIGNMTHEFKTPISTMSLSAQMLRDLADTVKPDFIRRNTNIIIDEGKRLTIQVEKILQMATFDRGKGKLKLEPMDVNEIVDKVVNNFRVKVESVKGEIGERLDAEKSMVMVDRVHFTNVIYNLLDNAFKYRRDAPMLNIWTRNINDGVVISVKDNGLGISKDDQKRIFDKFYRVSTGDKHDVKGFGLGLAYVKKIVEDHGGKISVESELNVGTKFDIYLPIIK